MEAGKILVTFKKDIFYGEFGPEGVRFAKELSDYRGETPKTITFVADEKMPKDRVLTLINARVRPKVKKQIVREQKYIGKTIIDVL